MFPDGEVEEMHLENYCRFCLFFSVTDAPCLSLLVKENAQLANYCAILEEEHQKKVI